MPNHGGFMEQTIPAAWTALRVMLLVPIAVTSPPVADASWKAHDSMLAPVRRLT